MPDREGHEPMGLVAVTAVGQDRTGIVAGFSGALYRLGANLEDTTMTRLGDQFAMILLARVPETVPAAELEATLRETADGLGLSLVIRRLEPGEHAAPTPAGDRYMLRVYGADRPGIVHAVTALLAECGHTITDLNTRVIPGGEGPVYVLMLEVEIATPAAAAALAPALERLGRELPVEVSFGPLDEEAL